MTREESQQTEHVQHSGNVKNYVFMSKFDPNAHVTFT
jgi:hypothetical protein